MEPSNLTTPAKRESPEFDQTTAAHNRPLDQSELKPAHPSESEHQPSEKSQVQEHERTLDELEHKIAEIGEQLKRIHYENLTVDRKDIKRRLELEDQRNQLRRELLEISHQHKLVMLQKEQATQEEAERERAEAQARYEEELKRLTEPKPEVNVSPAKEQPAPAASGEEAHEHKAEGAEPEAEAAGTTIEDNLRESRRNVRILEIEEELALSRLRRSRRAHLDAELSALRLYGSYPYYSSLYPYYYSYYPLRYY